jgi:hypothetical protein
VVVITMFDAGVSLPATSRSPPARLTHAPPSATTSTRKNLDRHPNCIHAAFMASGTYPTPTPTMPMRARHKNDDEKAQKDSKRRLTYLKEQRP